MVKTTLENSLRSLPITQIDLEIQGLGVIKTKAAVVDKNVMMSHCLLGNKSHKLIENIKNYPKPVNALTRSKTKATSETRESLESSMR